jgi:hypothetical protein
LLHVLACATVNQSHQKHDRTDHSFGCLALLAGSHMGPVEAERADRQRSDSLERRRQGGNGTLEQSVVVVGVCVAAQSGTRRAHQLSLCARGKPMTWQTRLKVATLRCLLLGEKSYRQITSDTLKVVFAGHLSLHERR